MTVDPSFGQEVSHLMAISLWITKCETKKEGIGFWASKMPFDREYIENGKSERYMSTRA